MDIKATIKELINGSSKTESDIAESIGMSRQSMSRRVNGGTLTAEQFLGICEACNAEARIVFKDSGKEVLGRDMSQGRHVRRMVGGIIYDTTHSVALGNNFDSGKIPMREAYRDEDGNYFFADYYRDGDMIVPSNGDEAVDYLNELSVLTSKLTNLYKENTRE